MSVSIGRWRGGSKTCLLPRDTTSTRSQVTSRSHSELRSEQYSSGQRVRTRARWPSTSTYGVLRTSRAFRRHISPISTRPCQVSSLSLLEIKLRGNTQDAPASVSRLQPAEDGTRGPPRNKTTDRLRESTDPSHAVLMIHTLHIASASNITVSVDHPLHSPGVSLQTAKPTITTSSQIPLVHKKNIKGFVTISLDELLSITIRQRLTCFGTYREPS